MANRVLHVLEPEPEGSIGGADTHVLQLATAQRGAGEFEPWLFLNQNAAFAAGAADAGIALLGGPHLAARKWASAAALARAVEAIRPQLIHSHGYDANFIVALARARSHALRSCRTVMTAHGWVAASIEHRWKTVIDLACHRLADGIILCSDHQRAQLGRIGHHRPTVVIPNGVDAPPRSSAPPSRAVAEACAARAAGRMVIATIGRLSPEKKVETAIQAFARSDACRSGVLLIVGTGPERARLERLIARKRLAGSVLLTGFAPDIGNLYRAIDILLHCSGSETSSRVTLEAMSLSRAVIASRVGGIPAIIRDEVDGLIVPPIDVDGFAAALDRLVASPALRRRLGHSAQERQRVSYSADTMGARVTAFYRRLEAAR